MSARTPVARVLRPVIAASLALLVVLQPVAGPPSAAAATCKDEKITKLKLTSTDEIYQIYTYITSSGKVVVGDPETVRPATRATNVTVSVRACKSGSTYKLRDYKVTQTHYDLKLTIVGESVDISPVDADYGFGLFVNSVGSSAVKLKATECTVDPRRLTGWDALHGVLKLPIPMPTWLKIGTAVASELLPKSPPDTFTCASIGSGVSFVFSFSKKGVASLSTKSASRVASSTWQVPCSYRYCSISERHVMRIKKA